MRARHQKHNDSAEPPLGVDVDALRIPIEIRADGTAHRHALFVRSDGPYEDLVDA
jgi:hypothetical protein